MKILHTSDWHLGHTLYGYDRQEEQQDMLQQILEITRKERPDAFLLSGDVYDIPQPSATSQKMFSEFMAKLHKAVPGMRIIVTAGNHDSGMRTEAFQSLLSMVDIHTIGTIDKEHPENHIIELAGKGFIIALPYASDRNIPDGFHETLCSMVAEKNTEGLPVVMMAHTTVKSADFSGHDQKFDNIIGGIEGVDISTFGDGFDYLALGHIHRPQTFHVKDPNRLIRYSGTPIATSFDEDVSHRTGVQDNTGCTDATVPKDAKETKEIKDPTDPTPTPPLEREGSGLSEHGHSLWEGSGLSEHGHSVSIVEVNSRGEEPTVRTERVKNIHPLITLPEDGPLPWNEVREVFDGYPSNIQSYIRLNVAIEDTLPSSAYAEVQEIAKKKACRFCLINAVRQEKSHTATHRTMELSEFQQQQPIDILKRYYHDKNGGDLPQDLEEMFLAAVKELEEQMRES